MKIFFILLFLSFIFADKITIIDIHESWKKYPSSSTIYENFEIELNEDQLINLQNQNIDRIKKERLDFLNNIIIHILKNENYLQAGIIYAQNYFYSNAIICFKKELSKTNNYAAMANIAQIYYIQGKYEKSINYYNKALEFSKNNPYILLSMSFLYYELGQFEQAKKIYTMAIIINPTLYRLEHDVIVSDNNYNKSKASNKGVNKIIGKWIR